MSLLTRAQVEAGQGGTMEIAFAAVGVRVRLPNGGMVTLTLSGLPDRSSATVTCSDENITVTKGSGNTWTAELPAGGASYTFAASYAGDGNHNGTTANCTVSVDKISPTLKLSPFLKCSLCVLSIE